MLALSGRASSGGARRAARAQFDYFASTAGANDSFISGPGGCGYVFYGRMSDAQVHGAWPPC